MRWWSAQGANRYRAPAPKPSFAWFATRAGCYTPAVPSLNETVDLLGRCLGTVLREQEGEAFFQLEERIRLETKRLREAKADTSPMQKELAAVELERCV